MDLLTKDCHSQFVAGSLKPIRAGIFKKNSYVTEQGDDLIADVFLQREETLLLLDLDINRLFENRDRIYKAAYFRQFQEKQCLSIVLQQKACDFVSYMSLFC